MQAAGLMVAPPGGKGDREGDREDGAGGGEFEVSHTYRYIRVGLRAHEKPA